jgi:hypothetical protein
MEFQQFGKKQKIITVENNVTPLIRLLAILFAPVVLAICFWVIFIMETDGLSPSSNYIEVIGGCIYKMLTQGSTECLPDLGYIILCSILGGPFAFFISYKFWKILKTKIILTDQRIIKKPPSGKEIQLYWNEIKKIEISSGKGGNLLIFTRNERSALFDDSNRILCPPNPNKERPFISREAANLILKKIDLYNISIRGNRELLEEIIKTPHKSRQGPTRPVAQNMTGRNRMLDRPSSAQRPTPK